MDKIGSKFLFPFKMLEVVNNNLVIEAERERTTVNFDQVRVYKLRNDNVSSRFPAFLTGFPTSRIT